MPTKTVKLPPQNKLREDFTYNAGTGDFTRYDGNWGFISNYGYCHISYEGSIYKVHRLIWKWWYGYDPEEIDHINGDRTDNRIDNLRNVNRSQNNTNTKIRTNNTSGYTGVSFDRIHSVWISRITINKKVIKVGQYRTAIEAKNARERYLRKHIPNTFSERHGK